MNLRFMLEKTGATLAAGKISLPAKRSCALRKACGATQDALP